ncbi:MAG: hypothetical protein J5I93_22715 [Pirellulaceae bacterium]|nr:hypothetical protein [Pirellulaceae bacterium]
MSWKQLLSHLHLSYLSQPAGERCLYRAIRLHQVRSIVEMGVGLGTRTRRMIEAVQVSSGDRPLRYTGIDLFEARPASQPGMTLKRAHQQFRPLVHRLQLVPGDPHAALARAANSLQGTDLLVIAADQDADSLRRCWFYVPRMLHSNSLVFVERVPNNQKGGQFQLISAHEIAALSVRASAPPKAA